MITFHPNLSLLMIGRGILGSGITNASAITIYGGAQPLVSDILANWTSYDSTSVNFLAHYSGCAWTHPLTNSVKFCSLTTIPAAVTPSHDGNARWCIVWTTNPLLAAMSGTIPTTSFLVGPVSNLGGLGIVKFDPDTSFTTSTPKAIADGAIAANLA